MTIEIREVLKVFLDPAKGSDTVALQEVSLSIGQNEFVVLLGPSGCGKTTLLNLVAGFDFPTAGSVLVGGRAVNGPGPERGVVFQSPNLFPWLSAYDNVLFGPRVRGQDLAGGARRATALLSLVGLAGFEGHRPHELSGGMQQRVAIARVLMNDPDILLADEPFASLDEHTRRAMQEEFLRIWEQTRTTVVFVTHNIEEAIYLADRIVVMSRRPGRVKAILPVDIPRPRDRTSAGFVELTRKALELIQPEVTV
ncbi:MAG: ABC transporter ATP-binding protein [candidate division NC10 bacterium]|nr:ABC transporter ATP-binding protein [candidate division NC10 bacterium]MBI2455921.1 ABC transporter ATP-binding protein [candidate division NC10 bacterium]